MCPVLLHVGPVQVHSYGVLLMLAFIAGILLSRRSARRLGVDPEVPVDLGVWILIASVACSRLLYVALNWSDYEARPLAVWQLWREGGLSYHGGLLGGMLAAAVYARRRRLSYWLLADMLSPGVSLGYGIARFGCFLNGCCYGAPTALPWGVRFPLYVDSHLTTEPSHPTQIYAAVGSFAILGLLLWLQPRLRAQGQLFASYLMLYAVLRSIVEIFRRGATAKVLFGPITQAQFASLFILLAALLVFVRLGRRAAARGSAGAGNTLSEPQASTRLSRPRD